MQPGAWGESGVTGSAKHQLTLLLLLRGASSSPSAASKHCSLAMLLKTQVGGQAGMNQDGKEGMLVSSNSLGSAILLLKVIMC